MEQNNIPRELTRAEEEIMQLLWDMGKGFVKDLVERYREPKPAYNTVSTLIRILEQKGFVGHTAYGKTHEYYPLVSKDEYRKHFLNNMISHYFSGSFKQLVSFFAREQKMNIKDLEEMLNTLKRESQQENK
ncbi:MAG: BlaI/MecI/CopY family transcriptional regulator [Bacteroidales bacterium]|nr:BlaI/MecI/CopY family transcriptional regulator [Bacteroidales bacterium]